MASAFEKVSERDLAILARTVYGEARGEPWAGKVAVAWVIRNRAADRRNRWRRTLAGVCLQARQFSAWNDADPNRFKLMTVDGGDSAFRDCLLAALSVLQGREGDPTAGALWYHAKRIAPPAWAEGKQAKVIGGQIFYREP